MRPQVFSQLMVQLEQLTPQQGQVVQEKVIQLQGCYALVTLGAARMAEQRGCSRCGAEHLQHWGRTGSGQQRYRCPRCGHSMTALSGTPLARLHGKVLLSRHAECMTAGQSLRQVAQTLGIHRNTAFRWRHRMMPLLAAHQPSQLTGVVESDEIFIRRSYKGQRTSLPRPAHHRGEAAATRGTSATGHLAILSSLARDSHACVLSILPGMPNAQEVTAVLGPRLNGHEAILCADSAAWYRTLARTLPIELHRITRRQHTQGPFHIQNVNALHSRLRAWLAPFRGVASRYLDRYLAWFRFLEQNPSAPPKTALLFDSAGLTAIPNTIR